jgi:hypothetical protein
LKNRRALVIAALASIGGAAVLLLRFPPEQYSFYPRCPVHEYLHLQCPGCGATRALAALLHGHLAQALHCNALFVALLPLLVSYAALCGYRACQVDRFKWPQPPRWGVQTTLALAAIFTIARNLPA